MLRSTHPPCTFDQINTEQLTHGSQGFTGTLGSDDGSPGFTVQLQQQQPRLLFHVASVGGRTDGPSCCPLFRLSANERPAAAQSQSNESSGVWARIESWVVQSVRRTTSSSSECTGRTDVGDGNITHSFSLIRRCVCCHGTLLRFWVIVGVFQ